MNSIPEKIILHFDINKTVIVIDPAGGKSVGDVVSGIVADTAWGTVRYDTSNNIEIPSWVPFSKECTVVPPQSNLLSYGNFVRNVLYKSLNFENNSENAKITLDEQLLLKKQHQKKRDAVLSVFTETGKIGEMFRPYYDRFMEQLKADTDSPIYILPCFLKFLNWLRNEDNQMLFERVVVVFRTFGKDIQDIHKEMCHLGFCDDNHDNMKIGNFYRNDPNSIYYIGGTIDQISSMDRQKFNSPDEISKYYNATKHERMHDLVLHGFDTIYEFFYSMKPSTFYFIRDYFNWWDVHNRIPQAGKVFIVDEIDHKMKGKCSSPSETCDDKEEVGKPEKILQIFFDDNIFIDEGKGIVDMRSRDGLILDYQDYVGYLLHHVEPFDSIRDEDYFINLFKKTMTKWQQKYI